MSCQPLIVKLLATTKSLISHFNPDLEAQFKQFPTSQTISNSRNYVSLPCQAPESNPAATINWYKDGVLIQVSRKSSESSYQILGQFLTILSYSWCFRVLLFHVHNQMMFDSPSSISRKLKVYLLSFLSPFPRWLYTFFSQNVENMFQEYKNKEEYGNLIIFNPLTTDSGTHVHTAYH